MESKIISLSKVKDHVDWIKSFLYQRSGVKYHLMFILYQSLAKKLNIICKVHIIKSKPFVWVSISVHKSKGCTYDVTMEAGTLRRMSNQMSFWVNCRSTAALCRSVPLNVLKKRRRITFGSRFFNSMGNSVFYILWIS